jgi:hypothetical protein
MITHFNMNLNWNWFITIPVKTIIMFDINTAAAALLDFRLLPTVLSFLAFSLTIHG